MRRRLGCCWLAWLPRPFGSGFHWGGVAAVCLALVCEVAGWMARLFAVWFAELQGTPGVGQREGLGGCPREEKGVQPLGMGE